MIFSGHSNIIAKKMNDRKIIISTKLFQIAIYTTLSKTPYPRANHMSIILQDFLLYLTAIWIANKK